MSTHANMVWATAASPGTGTITVSTAVSGYRTFAQGYNNADATVAGIRIEDAADPTIWEVASNCGYTYSTNALTRGTFENSSTGSLVNFTGAVVVSVVATADSGRRWDSAGLQTTTASVTTADVTGVVGTLHALNLSGLTADRTFTLPAVAAVDDRIGIVITTGDATYELLVTAASGDTLNGIAGGTEWSRLFITGETLTFRCVSANATWVIERDGRIPQLGMISLTGSDQTTSSTGWRGITCTNTDAAIGCTVSHTGPSTITWRRSSYVNISGSWSAKSSAACTDNEQLGWGCSYGGIVGTGTIMFIHNPNHPGTTARSVPGAGVGIVACPAGQAMYFSAYNVTTTDLGARALNYATYMRVQEILS